MTIVWYFPFWVLLLITLLIAGVTIAIRKLNFIDIQIMIMTVALTMSCDMLFCKQFKLYHYVSIEYRGWYSFWANLIIIPALGLVFIKFVPKSYKWVCAYIATWAVMGTLFETFISKPLGILVYSKWRIFPFSTIGYILVLTVLYVYYRILLKHRRSNKYQVS